MFDAFYDHTCNVWTETSTTVRGSARLSKVVKYAGIKCYYEPATNSSNRGQTLARETDKDKYTVYLPITYKDITKGELLELVSVTGLSIGEYIIDDVAVHSLSGCDDVSGISLQVSNR